jgi:hypothetical protein
LFELKQGWKITLQGCLDPNRAKISSCGVLEPQFTAPLRASDKPARDCPRRSPRICRLFAKLKPRHTRGRVFPRDADIIVSDTDIVVPDTSVSRPDTNVCRHETEGLFRARSDSRGWVPLERKLCFSQERKLSSNPAGFGIRKAGTQERSRRGRPFKH